MKLNSLLSTQELLSIDTKNIKNPVLIVIVDTEEEFDWSSAFRKENFSVKNIAKQHLLHPLFSTYNIKPNYLIDYPVASQKAGYKPLLELYNDGLCDIGTHLQPWVNPPFSETINNFNSYPGNLEYKLELSKLKILTKVIEDNLNIKPTIYKAGRYGLGKNTLNILNKLGYKFDCSVVPHTDFGVTQGPDFSQFSTKPFWIDSKKEILELPLSTGYTGILKNNQELIYNFIQNKYLKQLHIPGIFSKLHLLEKIRLSPEGYSFSEMKKLTMQLLAQDKKIFCLTYHSSSLLIGGSPYVQSNKELQHFIQKLEKYFSFFFNEINGSTISFSDLRIKLIKTNNTGIEHD